MKKTNRLLAALFAVLFVVTAFPMAASAAGGNANLSMTSNISEVEAVGDTVTFTLSNAAMTVTSLAGGIGFDTSKATCLSITGSRNNGNAYLVDPDGENVKATVTATVDDANQYGYASFAFAGTKDVAYQAGTLLTVSFRIDAADGATFTLFEDSDGADGYNSDSVATKTITVAPKLTGIAIKTAPSKVNYLVGETFSANGLVVEASYDNGTKANVTGYSVSAPDMNTAGVKTVTVTYEGKTATFTISVERVLTGISIKTAPSKVNYLVGEAFSANGLVVEASYNDGSKADVTGYSVSAPDMNTAGVKTVTVTYEDKTATFTITVEEVVVDELSATISVTEGDIFSGENVVWTINTTGGEGPYKYYYYINKNGVQTRAYGWKSGEGANTYTFKKAPEGNFSVRVLVKDATGKQISVIGGAVSVQKGLSATVSPSVKSTYAGDNVVWTVNTANNQGDCTYYYYVYKNGAQVRAYGWKSGEGANTYTFKNITAGTYTVKISVKDSATGKTTTVSGGEVNVIGITPSKSEIGAGGSVTWTITPPTETATYKYYFYLLKDGTQVRVAGWKDANTYTLNNAEIGTYTLKVAVKDVATGKTVTVTAGQVVSKETMTATITPSIEQGSVGDTIVWTINTAKAEGDCKYYYYIYKNGTQVRVAGWKTGDGANTYTFKNATAGTYTVKVSVKDAAGNAVSVKGGQVVIG